VSKMTDRCTCHDVLVIKNLNRWFKEKWVDVSRKDKDGKHPPCGRSKAKTSSKGYPKCRPSVKVSSETPKTSGSMSSGQKQAATKRKRAKKQGVGGKPTIVKEQQKLPSSLTQGATTSPLTADKWFKKPVSQPTPKPADSSTTQTSLTEFQKAFDFLKERKSPEAKQHKLEYDKKYESSPERVKYREELNRERRRRGIYGSGDHMDVSHTQGGKLTLESEHANRARHFKGRGTLRSQ